MSNLELMNAFTHDLELRDRSTFESYLLGALSNHVEESLWKRLCSDALRYTKND